MNTGIGSMGAPAPVSSTSGRETSVVREAAQSARGVVVPSQESADPGVVRGDIDAVDTRINGLVAKLAEGSLRPYAKLQIDADEETGAFIYKTIDTRTGEVIQQWPREELARIADFLNGKKGVVYDVKV